MSSDENLTVMLAFRVAQAEMDRLEKLAERMPVLSKTAFARAALLLGLDAIEKDPAKVLTRPVAKRGGKRR
jgi:hypothetical protein